MNQWRLQCMRDYRSYRITFWDEISYKEFRHGYGYILWNWSRLELINSGLVLKFQPTFPTWIKNKEVWLRNAAPICSDQLFIPNNVEPMYFSQKLKRNTVWQLEKLPFLLISKWDKIGEYFFKFSDFQSENMFMPKSTTGRHLIRW